MKQVADKQDMSVENIVVQEEQQYVDVEQEPEIFKFTEQKLEVPKVLGTIDLSLVGKDFRPLPKTKAERKKEFKELMKRKKEEEQRIKTDRMKSAATTQESASKIENTEESEKRKEDFIRTKVPTLQGPKIIDKVNLEPERPVGKEHSSKIGRTSCRERV